MEPLLIVGLGGIGSKIADAVYNRMLKDPALKNEVGQGIIQFLVIDTAKECWARGLATSYTPLPNGFTAAASTATLRMNAPFFDKCWPSQYLPAYAIVEGGQVRINGRLSWLEFAVNRRPKLFLERLNMAYTNALNYWNNPETGAAGQRSLSVAICGSGSGGTCSGILIDTAFAIRSYIQARGGINPNVHVFLLDHSAVMLNPEARIDALRIKANHAAMMLELEYWMNSSWNDKQTNPDAQYDVAYPDDFAVLNPPNENARITSPIDLVFHLTATFQDGSVMADGSYEPLIDLAAETIYTISRSPAGLANFATTATALQPGPNGLVQRHGSFGMISLRVPVEMIREHLAAKKSKPVVALSLGDPSKALAAAEASAATIITRLQLHEKDADEVIGRLRKERQDVQAIEPPDIAATLETLPEGTWESDLSQWEKQYDTWKQEFDVLAAKNADDLIMATVHAVENEILTTAGQGLAEAVELCEALKIQLKVQQQDLQLNRDIGVDTLRIQLKKDGILGGQQFDSLKSELRACYDRFFNRGLARAKENLAAFLQNRKAAEENLILEVRAVQVFAALLSETETWSESCRWVKRCLEHTQDTLNNYLTSGALNALGKRVQPLAPTLNFSARPLQTQSAFELHVLGSADIVDEMVGPQAWPESDQPEFLEERKRLFLGGRDHGVISLILETKRAKDAASRNDIMAWKALVARDEDGDLAMELAAEVKGVVGQKYQKFLDDLTLDKALALEAQFILQYRRENLREILGESGAGAVLDAIENTAGEMADKSEAAQKKIIELHLEVLEKKAMIACKRADNKPNIGGDPSSQNRIISGSRSLNPNVLEIFENKLGAGMYIDDRSRDDEADWEQRLALTYLAYGVELAWLFSFHNAMEAYTTWITTKDLTMFPVHTDDRYGSEWPFELPKTEGDVDVIVAFFTMYAYGQITKSDAAGFFVWLRKDNKERDSTLGRGCANAIDIVLKGGRLRERAVSRAREIGSGLRNLPYSFVQTSTLLEKALALALKEVEVSSGGSRRRCERAWKILADYVAEMESKMQTRLSQELMDMEKAGIKKSELKLPQFEPMS